MEILVFKTSLYDKQQVSVARKILNKINGILYWNVDLMDTDNILRIEADQLVPQHVETALRGAGYYCEELV